MTEPKQTQDGGSGGLQPRYDRRHFARCNVTKRVRRRADRSHEAGGGGGGRTRQGRKVGGSRAGFEWPLEGAGLHIQQ